MEKSISSDLIRGHIDTIILHALLDGDKYAQQISDTVELKSNNQYTINQATLYSSLKRLENLKYVSAYWFDIENGRRRFFRLTELGKKVVEENLSNWSYSCAIIDKLIGNEEKIIPTPVSVCDIVTETKKPDLDAPTQNENQTTTVVSSVVTPQELNFRNILNCLIKTNNVVPDTVEQNEEQPVAQSNEIKKEKFNETILEDTNGNYNTGKIDFGDLLQKANKEGYKIRISNKNVKVASGSVFINKVNYYSALIIFLVAICEFLCVSFAFKNTLNFSLRLTLIVILVFASFPIIMAVIYRKNPEKTLKTIKSDTILTAAIIIFNLLLITFAGNLLFNIDFADTRTVLLSLVCPIVLYFDVIIYFAIRFYLTKNNKFKVK